MCNICNGGINYCKNPKNLEGGGASKFFPTGGAGNSEGGHRGAGYLSGDWAGNILLYRGL